MSTSKLSMVKNGLVTKAGIFDPFLNRKTSSNLREWQLNFILLVKRGMAIFYKKFLYFGCHFRIRRLKRSSIVNRAFIRCPFFKYTIYKHCKWIMLFGPEFINESGHTKTLKIMTRNVDFEIPTLEIFLSKKIFWRTVGII